MDENTRLENRSAVLTDTIPASLATTLRAVGGTYETLEIPVTRVVDAENRLETRNARVSRLGGERLSRFLDCGQGISGQRADSYRVSITLLTSVHTTEDGRSRLVADFDATARPRDHSGSEVYCSSRGTLERLLVDQVRTRAVTSSR